MIIWRPWWRSRRAVERSVRLGVHGRPSGAQDALSTVRAMWSEYRGDHVEPEPIDVLERAFPRHTP